MGPGFWNTSVKECALRSARMMSNVLLNMAPQNNGHDVSKTQYERPRYTGERLLRERPKIYRQLVRLLREGWSANKIYKWCHVTRETVRAVERREAVEISNTSDAPPVTGAVAFS